LKGDLDAINKERLDALHDHLNTAVNNFMANIRWRFLNEDGPKIKQVTEREPLMHE
jgi:glycogen debranching enzyme